MKKSGTQFFATHEELIDYIDLIAHKFNLYVSQLSQSPYLFSSVDDISKLDLQKVSSIHLTKDKPSDELKTIREFESEHDFVIIINVGKFNGDALSESNLLYSSADPDELKLGNQVASILKKMTMLGAFFAHPTDPIGRYEKRVRYTEGARLLYQKGIKIQQFLIGEAYFRLEKMD